VTTTTEPHGPRWRRRLAIAGLVLLGGLATRGLAGLSPCVAVADHLTWREYETLRRARGQEQQPPVRPDPWGRPYEVRPEGGEPAVAVWSRGPDGVDQQGAGDDVPIYTGYWNIFFHWEGCVDARRWSVPLGALLALLVVAVTAAERAALASRATLARELARACVIAAVPAAVWLIVVDSAGAWLDRVLDTTWLLVPPRVAVAISGVAACVLVSLGIRGERREERDDGLTTERTSARARSGTHDLSDSFRPGEPGPKREAGSRGERDG
jgi:hypothetical protein